MPELKTAEINGIEMRYAIAGAGPAIFFLHGFPEYWGVWREQLAAFSADHLVVAPDMRGMGGTSRPSEVSDYHIDHLVGDIKALADHLGVNRFHLVAQDWGGLMAWPFVIRHPEYVETFSVIDITHPALFNRSLQQDPAQQEASQYMLAFRADGEAMIKADDYAFAKGAIFEDIKAHGGVLDSALEAEWWQLLRDDGHITAGLNYYRAAEIGPPSAGSPGGSNLIAGLSPEQLQVTCPVLILWAREDPYLLPTGLDGIESYVPNVTVKMIDGVSHWLALERPQLVTDELRQFFRAHV